MTTPPQDNFRTAANKAHNQSRKSMNLLRTIYSAFFAIALLGAYPQSAVAGDSPQVAIGTSYADATERLKAAGIAESGGLQMVSRDPDISLSFFQLDRDAILVVARSAATKSIKSLSIEYIPENRTSRTQVVSLAVRSIEFRSDKSYVVHFHPPAAGQQSK